MNKKDYKRLGDYIREVDVRNKDLKVSNLLGVSITKEFIPSIANTIGTDMSSYKIIHKGQFAYGPVTSRNGEKVSIALLNDDLAIISQAYTVFEVIDENNLLPQYLMMWFKRPEFDRYARFKSHGSAREIFDWEEMCNVYLPIPSIEKQREIVYNYETLTKRIQHNEIMIQKLEETTQTIYRKIFIDNIDRENLPEGWKLGTLTDLVELIDGDRGCNYPKEKDFSTSGFCLFLNTGNVTKSGFNFDNNHFISKEKDNILKKGKLKRYDIVLTTRGTVGNVAFFSNHVKYENIRINSGMIIIRSLNSDIKIMLYLLSLLKSKDFQLLIENYISGSAQPQLPIKDLKRIPIIIPCEKDIELYWRKSLTLINYVENIKKENKNLSNTQSLLLTQLIN